MEYIIAIAQTAFISMLVFYLQRKQKNSDAKAEERAKAIKEETLLQLEMSMANNKLSYALAMAVKNGKHNGEVEEAVEAYEKAKKNFYKFMNKQAIEHLKEK